MANDGTKRYACTSYDDDTSGDPIDSSLDSCKWAIDVPRYATFVWGSCFSHWCFSDLSGQFTATIKCKDGKTYWGVKKLVDKEVNALTCSL
jgi:hypothetical protein